MCPQAVSRHMHTWRAGALAGIAGGLAELVWVASYGALTGAPLEPVARGIVVSISPTLANAVSGAPLGIAIHMTLATALGVGLALALRPLSRWQRTARFEFAVVVLALAAVWAVNFLVALPRINPAFIELLPYAVTLLSKLFFGFSAATVLHVARIRRQRVMHGCAARFNARRAANGLV